MALSPGSRLGPYEVAALIGQGGMGEVYRAKDTKLGRDVALKVLPDLFADDPERLARFQREARVLASLNHPNIASIYGLEESGDTRALVLELVEGPTLAERIAQGAIPVDEALPIAKQIAEALEAAHEAGVIHRDLKPANVKVKDDGMVKVLDFGLAKALEGDAGSDPSESPTLTAAATRMGVIMGTAAYMSPEQAKGKVVDKRADVWAFGAVLYEMLTAKRAFVGGDVSDTLAAVLRAEVDLDALPKATPARLRHVVKVCLQKEARQRVGDIAAVRLAMDGAFETTVGVSAADSAVSQPAGWRQALPWVAGLVLAVITGLAVWSVARPASPPVSRFPLLAPPGVQLRGFVELAPDGRAVAFGGRREGEDQVYIRALDQLEAVPVRGTEGMNIPFGFSPEGQWLLVTDSAASTLKRVRLIGGPAETIVETRVRGSAWGPDDTIVQGGQEGLWLVSASGGDRTQLVTRAEGEGPHVTTEFLPSGRAVLFYAWSGSEATGQIAVYDFETEQRTNLLPGTTPRFATTGHLIFWRAGSLWAVPFDPDRLEVQGDPVPVVEGVSLASPAVGFASYTLASNGTLVYLPEPGDAGATSALGWVDREGVMTTPLVEGIGLAWPRLSPDGTRVALRKLSETWDEDIWIRDLARGSEERLTETGLNRSPVWTPDGTMVTFQSNRTGLYHLYSRPVDHSRETELILTSEFHKMPGSWTPDGQTLVYYANNASGPAGDRDIWMLPDDSDAVEFLATELNERGPRLSPNGNWLAYVSNQSGEDQIRVTAFPDGGQVVTVSTGPGAEAVWSRDGQELFYRNGDELWVVDVETESAFTAGRPRLLFEAPYDLEVYSGIAGYANYDVSLDGQQFLMVRSGAAAEAQAFTVVENWFEELKERVPVP